MSVPDLGIFVSDIGDRPEIDFDIVIAHRGPGLGLWATIQSCESDLEGKGYNYRYLICTNGEEKLSGDTSNVIHFVKTNGKLGYHKHYPEPLSPPTARNRAATQGFGKYIFFFDNHCLVKPGYFQRALEQLDKYKMDLLHSTTIFYSGQDPVYHYKLKLEKNFWAEATEFPANQTEPYKVAAGGHGGFVVTRSSWEDVGGYWDGFIGYGGEEIYLDLLMWMVGYECYLDPQLIHYHFAGNRGYPRHYTDEFYTNMMACASIVGGTDWLYKVFNSFTTGYPKTRTGKSYFDLMMEADERSREHAAWFRSVAHRTLDDQLRWFKDNSIAH